MRAKIRREPEKKKKQHLELRHYVLKQEQDAMKMNNQRPLRN